MTAVEFGVMCVSAFNDECPDDPRVVAYRESLARLSELTDELRRLIEERDDDG